MDVTSVLEMSTIDWMLLSFLLVLVYRWYKRNTEAEVQRPEPPKYKKMEMMDMTVEEIRKYDGSVEDENILLAVNGTIFDVSRGKSFYGPGGAYGKLAGHDATRALGTMDANAVKEEWDDCEDLKPDERESADEWHSSFKYKYPTIGKLVKDASEKTDYKGKMAEIASFDWAPKKPTPAAGDAPAAHESKKDE